MSKKEIHKGGCLCGKVALNESATLGLQQVGKDTDYKSDEFTNGENRESTQINSSIHKQQTT